MNLCDVKTVKDIMAMFGLNFQKKFGQNFLIDSNILENIIEAANVTKQDCVLDNPLHGRSG